MSVVVPIIGTKSRGQARPFVSLGQRQHPAPRSDRQALSHPRQPLARLPDLIGSRGLKQLPKHAGEYLLEVVMRRYENRATIMTSNRPLEDWGKLLQDVPTMITFPLAD